MTTHRECVCRDLQRHDGKCNVLGEQFVTMMGPMSVIKSQEEAEVSHGIIQDSTITRRLHLAVPPSSQS